MYKVLIIDDEAAIRKGLKSIIPWEDYAFTICGDAFNGEDGLTKVADLKPDLIMVDMKMPRMSGIDFIKRLREVDKQTRVIILSGYSEFMFAQKALEYDVNCYLLKPIDKIQLIEVLQKIRDDISAEIKKKEKESQFIQMSRNQALEAIVKCELEGSTLKEYNALFGFDFPWDHYQIILLEPENKAVPEYDRVNSGLCEIDAYLSQGDRGFFFFIGNDAAILSKLRLTEKSDKYFNEIDHIFSGVIGSCAVFALGPIVASQKEIIHSYYEARVLFGNRFVYSQQRILSGKSQSLTLIKSTLSQQDSMCKYINKLCMAVDVNNAKELDAVMMEIRDNVMITGMSAENVKIWYASIYNAVLNKLLASNEHMKGLIESNDYILYEIFKRKSLQQLHEFISNSLRSLANEISNMKPNNTIDQIIDYINRNYAKDIKLDYLSHMFKYNSIYLGKMFKNHTGMYFNTYLDTVRMEKAKQLLMDGGKITQVAQQVGYEDIRYFYTKFKKYTGQSPSFFKSGKDI